MTPGAILMQVVGAMRYILSRLLLSLSVVIIFAGTANGGKKVKLPFDINKSSSDSKLLVDPMKEEFQLKEPVRLTCSGTMLSQIKCKWSSDKK